MVVLSGVRCGDGILSEMCPAGFGGLISSEISPRKIWGL